MLSNIFRTSLSLLFVMSLLLIQACSSSKNESIQAQSDDGPIEVKTLGGLRNDEADILSLGSTGLKWSASKDMASRTAYDQEAYRKGCKENGQFGEVMQVDSSLRVGQSFKEISNEIGQAHQLTRVTKHTLVDIDKKNINLIVSKSLIESSDSRLADYQGPVILMNPYEKVKLSLGKAKLTNLPVPVSETLESHFHPDFIAKLKASPVLTKVYCHMEENQNSTELLALGNVTMKNGKTMKATKKIKLSAGVVICERIDNSFISKNEAKKSGPSHKIGIGKDIHVIIASNEVPSLKFNFCGGTKLLDFRLLVLDDGRVIQQRMNVLQSVD
ncbi:MAG: hypothetical protein AABY64_01240 [Bdellovibrionota bacterium]